MEITATPTPTHQTCPSPLRAAAENLEAAFLSEMMKSAGLGAMKGGFSGGAGEDQFASLLRQEQARLMVEGGGIGLTEHLVQSMAVRQ